MIEFNLLMEYRFKFWSNFVFSIDWDLEMLFFGINLEIFMALQVRSIN